MMTVQTYAQACKQIIPSISFLKRHPHIFQILYEDIMKLSQ